MGRGPDARVCRVAKRWFTVLAPYRHTLNPKPIGTIGFLRLSTLPIPRPPIFGSLNNLHAVCSERAHHIPEP